MLVEDTRSESTSTSDELKVLITGFAPFYEPPVPNPSSALLPFLPVRIPETATHAAIRIKTLPAVRVSYDAVLDLVPTLAQHDFLAPDSAHVSSPEVASASTEQPDIIIHIGMSFPKAAFTLETIARRDGYFRPDVEGQYLSAGGVVQDWVSEKRPETLPVNLRKSTPESVWRRWRSALLLLLPPGKGAIDGDGRVGDVEVVLSKDAGLFLCEFVLYASLSFWWAKRKREEIARDSDKGETLTLSGRKEKSDPVVVFLHVPAECERQDLERDAEVVVALVQALAESCFDHKKRD